MLQSSLIRIVLGVYISLNLLMLPANSFVKSLLLKQELSKQEIILINPNSLRSIDPIFITYHPEQIMLEEAEKNKLRVWIKNINILDLPINIYSYATSPINRMDMTKGSAQHIAIRKSFNRAIEAKKFLKSQGMLEAQITLHAIEPVDNISRDQLHITIGN